jgi:hypothetical protein
VQPSFGAIARSVAHCNGCSGACSRTSRTVHSRSSGEYLVSRPTGPILSPNGPSDKPGTVQAGRVPLPAPFGKHS